ncbi:restriction modification system DNA specificity domain protein [Klebsiella variicola At-22]|uniref:restriction endonuclease subunit S n=1 Tax=Klebsiella variicola TaxID=244366 RepID=UPI0001BDC1D3|nr:restriction endonuclease subunit S [Klebsiella variicola]ADC60379.1 restriction modification system DNA specificity domain protein [Klebsiella variicola At-22]
MGSKWIECELGDFIELKRGYDLPKSTRNEGSIPIISSSGFTDFHDKPMVKGPGVVTGRYGTIGEVFYSEEDFWPLNTTLYVVDFKGNDRLFVYYLLQTISYADYTDKAAVPGVNRNHLHKAKVKVPISLDIQQKVAAQLYQLEKRVALSKQINQTLEQMSQTLFKSWFVDFDPVIDNALDAGNSIPEALQSRAELRQKVRNNADFKPLPADIRALFPDDFEETELGWIPKNWHIRDFSDIAVLIKNNIKSDDICDDIHYIGLEHLERKHIFITSYGNGSDVSSNKSAFNKGDLLFGKLRPYFHKVAITPFSGICSTDILVFRAKEKFYKSLMAMYSFTDEFVAYANLRSTGTRMPRAEAKDLLKYKIILPNKDILEKFELLLEDYWAKGQLNNNENDHLTALRDTLLPKLISGELSLEDLPDLVTQTEPA